MAKAGDLFSFPLTPTEWLSGRVLLDVKEQCIKPRRLAADSPLAFFNGAVLVEIYASPTREPAVHDGPLLISSIFVVPGFKGDWKAVGYREVDPTMLDFPAGLVMRGIKPHLRWGELLLPTDLTWEDSDRLNVAVSTHSWGILPAVCLVALGRGADLDPAQYPNPGALSLAATDLRMSSEGPGVFARAGLPSKPRYFDEALARGYDPRRFFA